MARPFAVTSHFSSPTELTGHLHSFPGRLGRWSVFLNAISPTVGFFDMRHTHVRALEGTRTERTSERFLLCIYQSAAAQPVSLWGSRRKITYSSMSFEVFSSDKGLVAYITLVLSQQMTDLTSWKERTWHGVSALQVFSSLRSVLPVSLRRSHACSARQVDR